MKRQQVWSNIELRGQLMTGSQVSELLPHFPLTTSSSADVYFVGYTTFLRDLPGRVMGASVDIRVEGLLTRSIDICRGGHFSKGDREFYVQLWGSRDVLSVADLGIEPSAIEMTPAERAISQGFTVRAKKVFVK